MSHINHKRPIVILAYPAINYQANYECTWLPYSVLYIADALRTQNLVDVIVYDANIPQEESWESLVRRSAARLLAVGFSIMTGGHQITGALGMAATVLHYAPQAVRFFGGPHANVLPRQTCQHPLVDCVAAGPGQFVVPPLVEALFAGVAPHGLAGVWTKSCSSDVNEPKPFGTTWSADGLSHWDAVDAASYIKEDDALLGPRVLNYISSFGCAYQCRFCYEQQYAHRYHAIPAQKVVDDVKGLAQRYRLTGMKFYDADFFINGQRAERIWTDLAETTGLSWAASIHPNDVIRYVAQDTTTLKRMAQAGCKRLLMGVESGDELVLASIVRKMTTPAKIYDAACAIDEAGIRGAYTFILGFPGETAEEKRHTVEFAKRLADLPTSPEIRFHGFAPYPGTPLFQVAQADGFVPPQSLEEWACFDYYAMKTKWLTDEDLQVIQEWSKVTGRRRIEREGMAA